MKWAPELVAMAGRERTIVAVCAPSPQNQACSALCHNEAGLPVQGDTRLSIKSVNQIRSFLQGLLNGEGGARQSFGTREKEETSCAEASADDENTNAEAQKHSVISQTVHNHPSHNPIVDLVVVWATVTLTCVASPSLP